MARDYISTRGLGYAEADRNPNRIIISFYGPKGGTRSIEEISREEAAKLRDSLTAVVGPDRTVIDALDMARAFIAEAIHSDARWHNEVADAVNAAIAEAEGNPS